MRTLKRVYSLVLAISIILTIPSLNGDLVLDCPLVCPTLMCCQYMTSSLCSGENNNVTIDVGDRNVTILSQNITEVYEYRPQLMNDSTFSEILSNYSESLLYFTGSGEILILAGFNGSIFLEIVIRLSSSEGSVEDYVIVTDEGLDYNVTRIIGRTVEELSARNHILVDNVVMPLLWSGEYGSPTYSGPNNKYTNNASFDVIHWEIMFRTNDTQWLPYIEPEETEVISDGMMFFLSNGTLLDFYIISIPLGQGPPLLLYAIITLSAIIVTILITVFFKRRR